MSASLAISEELIAPGRPNRPGTKINPTYITIHNTANSNEGADADAHSRFVRNKGYYDWKGKKRWVSWHFTVDDTEIIKQLPLNEAAYHAGKGNSVSIAIEQCMHQGIDTGAADERLCQLVAALCEAHSIPTSKIVPHKHWTGKNCPVLLLKKWDQIINRVKTLRNNRELLSVQVMSETEMLGSAIDELSEEAQAQLQEFDIEDDVLFDLSEASE
jgi:N-acetylmuramoyl-L-alanine amidase CwlA